MPRPTDLTAVGILVLARLLPAGDKGEARDKLGKDLRPLVQHRWDGAAWTDRLDRELEALETAGAVVRSKKGKAERLTLTEEGRRLALKALGLDELPPKTTWTKLKSPYLLALALGRPSSTGADVKHLSGAAGLKAELLRSGFGLALGDRPTPKQAADALAASLLGLEPGQPFTADSILLALLRGQGIELKPAQKPNPKNIQEALFRRELGDSAVKNPLDGLVTRSVGARQSKTSELSEAALRSWVDRSESAAGSSVPSGDMDSPASVDLGDFSRLVLEAARNSPTGRFGDGKVFIAHVWRAVREDPAMRGMDAGAFKSRLVDAHRARWLELGRGDLVEAMDPDDVRESATTNLNAVYHFVRTEGDVR